MAVEQIFRQALQDLSLVPLACAVLSAAAAGFVAKMFCARPPPLVPIIPKPRGLKGFLFGHMSVMLPASFGAMSLGYAERLIRENGPRETTFVFEFWPGNYRIVVCHPRDLEYLFLDNPSNYVKGVDYDQLVPIIGNENLVTLRNETEHAEKRKLINPAFAPAVLKRIAQSVVTKHAAHYMEEVGDLSDATVGAPKKPRKLADIFDDIALSVVAEAAFNHTTLAGLDVRQEFRRVLETASSSPILTFPPWLIKVFPQFRTIVSSSKKLRQFGLQIADQARKRSATEGTEGGTLLDNLVREEAIGSSALLDHIVTFLFAGHESTSKSLLWTSYLLAANPDVQAHLFEELSSAVPRSAVATLDSVKDLPYLNQVLKESLRLYPPFPVLVRYSVRDDVLPYSKAFIPANRPVIINMLLTQRLSAVYGPDSNEFKPERWNKELGLEERLGRCGWLPFIAGKRNCIGKDFAWNELTMVLATLMRRYELSLPPNYPEPKRKFNISMQPVDPIPFTLSPRE